MGKASKVGWLIVGAAAGYLGYERLWRQPPLLDIPAARPQKDFDSAVEAAQSQIAEHAPGMRPECAARLFTHGRQTDRAIVLL
ncbi:hypothetical protein, partial [uncultured Caldilinea sp.]